MNLNKLFKIIFPLGYGSIGITYLVKNQKGKQFALKAINVNNLIANGLDVDDVLDEIDTLIDLSSQPHCFPYIVCYFAYYRGSLGGHDTIAILSEYINGPTLKTYISKIRKTGYIVPPDQLSSYMYQLIVALDYVHRKGYAHRDIKPSNIVLDTNDNIVKLIDFSLACQHQCSGTVGTLYWMSPELFQNLLPNSLIASQSHDIWSLGLVFYELANHRLPFTLNSNTTSKEFKKIINKPFMHSKYSSGTAIDEKINKMIDQMLRKEWIERPTTSELLNYIEIYLS